MNLCRILAPLSIHLWMMQVQLVTSFTVTHRSIHDPILKRSLYSSNLFTIPPENDGANDDDSKDDMTTDNNGNGNGNGDGDDNYIDNDINFLRELQQAKAEKLGALIPEEQQKAAAESATNDFLAAMKQVRADFQKSKEELGGDADAAIDVLKSQWDQEERLRDDVEGGDIFGEFE